MLVASFLAGLDEAPAQRAPQQAPTRALDKLLLPARARKLVPAVQEEQAAQLVAAPAGEEVEVPARAPRGACSYWCANAVNTHPAYVCTHEWANPQCSACAFCSHKAIALRDKWRASGLGISPEGCAKCVEGQQRAVAAQKAAAEAHKAAEALAIGMVTGNDVSGGWGGARRGGWRWPVRTDVGRV